MSSPAQANWDLPRSRRSFYMQLYVAALIYIIIADASFMIVYSLSAEDPIENGCHIALVFYVLGLFTFCIYINVRRLRLKFPVNWFMCSGIALCLILGVSFQLSSQNYEQTLLATIEALLLLSCFLLAGSWLPPRWHPLVYILVIMLLTIVVATIALFIFAPIFDAVQHWPVWVEHGLLWCLFSPILVFQAQVINGLLENILPIQDVPLCGLLLLIDFLACYACFSSSEEIVFGFYKMYLDRTLIQRVIESDAL